MNCATTRSRILALADPSSLPEPLLTHLDGCAACSTWHRLAVQVERVVANLPVPVSEGNGKRRLLSKFQDSPAPVATRKKTPSRTAKPGKIIEISPAAKAAIRPAKPRQPLGERLARLWPAGLVAAAILVGAVSWAIYKSKSKDTTVASNPGPDPMLREVVAAKVKLDTAHSAADRVEVLSTLADTLHDEARALSKVTPGDNMAALARMYEQVVRDGLVPQARAMSAEERRTKLPAFKEKLVKAEQEANRLAAEAPVGSDRPLKEMAETAKSGRIELAKLIQESEL